MEEIQPKYVSFENAKLLKEKGFDVEEPCTCGGYPTCICDEVRSSKHIYKPEHWVVIEWLRIKHNLWLIADNILSHDANEPSSFDWQCTNLLTDEVIYDDSIFNTPTEAIENGITHILTHLI
jgi:hypothetical protein